MSDRLEFPSDQYTPSEWVMRRYNGGGSIQHMHDLLTKLIANIEHGEAWLATETYTNAVARLKAVKAYQLIGLPDRKPRPATSS